MIIHHLFPEPVCFSKLERSLTKQELKTLDKYKKKTKNNQGNTITTPNYILENKALKNLKKDLHKKVIDYFNEVVCSSNSIIPYITQSWLTYTETDQFHHMHNHVNSYLSGVFYVSADKEVDTIKFYKNNYQGIEVAVSQHNLYNSTSWWYPVETGDVVLFPAHLVHGVEKKKGTNLRITLSFNVFFKGTIGDHKNLTELVIK